MDIIVNQCRALMGAAALVQLARKQGLDAARAGDGQTASDCARRLCYYETLADSLVPGIVDYSPDPDFPPEPFAEAITADRIITLTGPEAPLPSVIIDERPLLISGAACHLRLVGGNRR